MGRKWGNESSDFRALSGGEDEGAGNRRHGADSPCKTTRITAPRTAQTLRRQRACKHTGADHCAEALGHTVPTRGSHSLASWSAGDPPACDTLFRTTLPPPMPFPTRGKMVPPHPPGVGCQVTVPHQPPREPYYPRTRTLWGTEIAAENEIIANDLPQSRCRCRVGVDHIRPGGKHGSIGFHFGEGSPKSPANPITPVSPGSPFEDGLGSRPGLP